MLIEITYKNERDPFLAISNNIVYAYVENVINADETTGLLSADPTSKLVLRFETPNSQVIALETREMLYKIYKEINENIDNIQNIALYNAQDYIETIDNDDGTFDEKVTNQNAPILDTASIGLTPNFVTLIDRALTVQTQDDNDYSGISVQVRLCWNEGG